MPFLFTLYFIKLLNCQIKFPIKLLAFVLSFASCKVVIHIPDTFTIFLFFYFALNHTGLFAEIDWMQPYLDLKPVNQLNLFM